MRKVWMYIDGFNFYYGLRDLLRDRPDLPVGLGCCDFRKLAVRHLIDGECTLEQIKYFTAPVKNFLRHEDEDMRQQRWLQAVATIDKLEIIEGFHAPGKVVDEPDSRQEKLTDVNIAVELILDALLPNGYDEALLITGDVDLVPAVLAVQKRIPGQKRVSVWTPFAKPSRLWEKRVRDQGVPCQEIKPEMLADSRLDDRIIPKDGGTPIDCLPEWKMPEA